MDILFYFLPAIIFIGAITSYEDIKYGKIKNFYIILGLIYAFFAYFAIFLINGQIFQVIILETITNFIFSIIAGYGLYHYGIWSAGDGKLFIVFSLLIPITVYKINYQRYIPSVVLVLNVFIIAFIIALFLFVKAKNKIKGKTILKDYLKDQLNFNKLLISFLKIFALLWLIDILFDLIGIEISFIVKMGVSFLINILIYKYNNKIILWISIFLGISRIIIDRQTMTLNFITGFLLIFAIYRMIVPFLNKIFTEATTDSNIGNKLVKYTKEGMIPAEMILKTKNLSMEQIRLYQKNDCEIIRKKKEYYIKIGVDNKLGLEENENFEVLIPAKIPIDYEQIKVLRKTGYKNLKFYKSLAFSPIIFVAATATILFGGNLLIIFIYTIKLIKLIGVL